MAETNVVVITGGAQGIGRGTARYLLQKGYAVAIVDADREALDEAEAELRTYGAVAAFQADVSDENEVEQAVDAICRKTGEPGYLMNNAGVTRPFNEDPENLRLEDWNRMISVNLTGCMICTKYCTPYLRKYRGSIVQIASTRGLMSEPNSEAYAASKGGILALTHALALSLGPEVTVNAISPGWIDVSAEQKASQRKPFTPKDHHHRQHPAGRIGRVEDVASLTAYLFSDEARFITGENFVVDGGMTRKMIYD